MDVGWIHSWVGLGWVGLGWVELGWVENFPVLVGWVGFIYAHGNFFCKPHDIYLSLA